jgi:hypothetical protein
VPARGGFGLDDARIVAVGDPFRSTLFYRMATTGPGRMPHIGSEIGDAEGLTLMHASEAQRVRRLGTSIDPAVILAVEGDAARGRVLFLQSAAVQCRTCHVVGSEGRAVGPALDGVGGRLDTMKLLESLLEPSKVISPKTSQPGSAVEPLKVTWPRGQTAGRCFPT